MIKYLGILLLLLSSSNVYALELSESAEDNKSHKLGLSYLDICNVKRVDGKGVFGGYKNGLIGFIKNKDIHLDHCGEYYSYANDKNLFTLEEYDVKSFDASPGQNNGKYIAFTTKIKVPKTLIRDNKVNIESTGFYGHGRLRDLTTSNQGTFSLNYKFVYQVNGQFIDDSSQLIELKEKDSIELTLYTYVFSDNNTMANHMNFAWLENKNNVITFLTTIFNHYLSFKEQKRGKKKISKISKNNIFNIGE